jgi:hypothetical protein
MPGIGEGVAIGEGIGPPAPGPVAAPPGSPAPIGGSFGAPIFFGIGIGNGICPLLDSV